MNAKTLAAQFMRRHGHVFDGEPDTYAWCNITRPALDQVITDYLQILQGTSDYQLRWNGFPDHPENEGEESNPELAYVSFVDYSRRYPFHEHISFPHWTSVRFPIEKHVELMLRRVRKAVQRFNRERPDELD